MYTDKYYIFHKFYIYKTKKKNENKMLCIENIYDG